MLGWLPDGSALVGQTMRWSPATDGNYDIAVFDTATGAARQITRGPAQDIDPQVSPDGTRVAFIRGSMVDPPQLCITTIDGQHEPECRLIGGQPIATLLGWTGLDELALTTVPTGVGSPGRPGWMAWSACATWSCRWTPRQGTAGRRSWPRA
ncbi:MAG: PD40 domain-containing protein [Gemmatimonadaceae bacterium]|nr:PD40 domain-containing protein [Gemmatimonadaceae bacterium]